MQMDMEAPAVSRTRVRLGSILTGLAALFLVFDGVTKIIPVQPVIQACEKLGLEAGLLPGIGILLLVCTATYAVPRTAVIGAILLTGYLGGAAAIHVSAHSGAFPVGFAVGFGALVWASLILREPRLLRALFLRGNPRRAQ